MRYKLKPSIFFLSLGTLFVFGVNSDNGKAGFTGAPGENTCTNCHAGTAVNAGGGSIMITTSNQNGNANLTNWEYSPGVTYNVSVTVSEPNKNLFGFGTEALLSSGANGGTVNAGTGSSIKNATVSGNVRRNVVHNLNAGTGSRSHTFNFTWTAPTSNVGNITLYATGVAANANGSDNGDHVYKTSQVLTPASATSVVDQDLVSSWRVISSSVNGQFGVFGTSASGGDLNIQWYNLQGQLVRNDQNLTVSGGKIAHWLDVSPLPSGMYIVRVLLDQNEVLTQKIVK